MPLHPTCSLLNYNSFYGYALRCLPLIRRPYPLTACPSDRHRKTTHAPYLAYDCRLIIHPFPLQSFFPPRRLGFGWATSFHNRKFIFCVPYSVHIALPIRDASLKALFTFWCCGQAVGINRYPTHCVSSIPLSLRQPPTENAYTPRKNAPPLSLHSALIKLQFFYRTDNWQLQIDNCPALAIFFRHTTQRFCRRYSIIISTPPITVLIHIFPPPTFPAGFGGYALKTSNHMLRRQNPEPRFVRLVPIFHIVPSTLDFWQCPNLKIIIAVLIMEQLFIALCLIKCGKLCVDIDKQKK